MPIIMISSPPFSGGNIVAETLSKQMGYELIDDELMETSAKKYKVHVEKFKTALKRAPSLFGMSQEEILKYTAYFQATLLSTLTRDKIIYHGSVAHMMVSGVSHVLKAYIVANINDRASRMAATEGIDEKKALKEIQKLDKEHKKWIKTLFNTDDSNPVLYDMVLNIGQITVEDAAKIIQDASENRRFQPMTYSEQCMRNLALSSRVRAELITIDSNIVVRADYGDLTIQTKAMEKDKEKKITSIREALKDFDGVKKVEINVVEDFFGQVSTMLR
ncbi:MAG: cytidylate kinase-like family protein [Nitrospirae bacterium]|nr:cytidylate kinase-like family protein [Nitrospirota bacterium]MBF0535457.1 cytidylate kinase-like family protein [Nitrospirota bacterium]MBF0617645.1 cytidylate kinase-like family protein [Nitrospirota bacterium]